MSYEMLMQLVLAYLKDKKDFRMSTLDLESENVDAMSKTSINNKDNNNDDIEEGRLINRTRSILPTEEKKKHKKPHFIEEIHDSDEEEA